MLIVEMGDSTSLIVIRLRVYLNHIIELIIRLSTWQDKISKEQIKEVEHVRHSQINVFRALKSYNQLRRIFSFL